MRKIYLDANFLLAIFIPNHSLQIPALRLFANLRIKKCKLYISPLVLDETWWIIYAEKKRTKQVKSGIKECFEEIKASWKAVKEYGVIDLIQIKQPIEKGVEKSLEFINKFNLHPRDAFHLAIANSHQIKEIVTSDPDMINNVGQDKNFNIIDFSNDKTNSLAD